MKKEEYLNRIMTIREMLIVINEEIGKPIVKDGGKKILANPFKFIREGDEYVLYRSAEKIGMTEVLRTTNEDKACRIFIIPPRKTSAELCSSGDISGIAAYCRLLFL